MHQHRQIHVWISESDYLLLREQSVVARDSVSAVIRRLIKSERQRLKDEGPMRMAGAGCRRAYTSDQSECGRLLSTSHP